MTKVKRLKLTKTQITTSDIEYPNLFYIDSCIAFGTSTELKILGPPLGAAPLDPCHTLVQNASQKKLAMGLVLDPTNLNKFKNKLDYFISFKLI